MKKEDLERIKDEEKADLSLPRDNLNKPVDEDFDDDIKEINLDDKKSKKNEVSKEEKQRKRRIFAFVLFILLDIALVCVILWQIVSLFASLGN